MTYSIPRISAIAIGVAALTSLSTLSAARADSAAAPAATAAAPSTAPAPTPPARPASTASAAAPSLNEPAPTPAWAEAGPSGTTVAQHPAVRHYAHRHYAYGRRYYNGNPVTTAATGVAGGVADLGSIAAYPFYCFPNYGSCSVRVPYRYSGGVLTDQNSGSRRFSELPGVTVLFPDLQSRTGLGALSGRFEQPLHFVNQISKMKRLGEDSGVLWRRVGGIERHGGEARDEHDLDFRVELGGATSQLDAVHLRHDDIRQQELERFLSQPVVSRSPLSKDVTS